MPQADAESAPDAAPTHAEAASAPRRTRRFRVIQRIGVATGALLGAGGFAVILVGCLTAPPPVGSVSTAQRIAAFPSGAADVKGEVTIWWDAHQIPFIEAERDEDVPFAIGMVHAHLRLGQMEILRRIAQGRVAESAGPLPVAVNLDHTLRTLDFGKAADAIARDLRADTRAWLERYVAGINAYRARAARPLECAVLGIADEPWRVRDVLLLGRLLGTDINWMRLAAWLRLKDEPGWAEVWERVTRHHQAATPSFGGDAAIRLLPMVSRSGSNSFVVSGARTASGKPLISNDPHVGMTLPPLWCQIGFRSPSYHVSGLTIPGAPFVVLGRNARIAWGGTNLRGISTSLYDLASVPESELTARTETIRRRGWRPAARTVRDSPWGVVISDAPFFTPASGGPYALRWRGHAPSDEFSAFLDVSRAETWEDFRRAFAPYAVSGQNFLFADVAGNIGHLIAFEFQPAAGRAAARFVSDPKNPDDQWGAPIRSTELPCAFNPPEGFLVSTNNTPVRTDPPLDPDGNADDRRVRIAELIAAKTPLDRAAAVSIQMDVFAASSRKLAQALTQRAAALGRTRDATLDLLSAWDGAYTTDSRGAVALQAVAAALGRAHYARRYSPRIAEHLLGGTEFYALLAEDVETGRCDADLPAALDRARDAATRPWGDIHTLRLSHWIGMVPYLGRRWRFGEFGVAGSLTTVFKTAHGVTAEPHRTTYGANARQVMDLSDPDASWLALLGGQDGWAGSANFLDQVEAWRTGELIRVPMRPETVHREAVASSRLMPPRKE